MLHSEGKKFGPVIHSFNKKASGGHARTGSMGSSNLINPTLSSLLNSGKKELTQSAALSSLTGSQTEQSSGVSKSKKKVSLISDNLDRREFSKLPQHRSR